jgi:type I restriction enzyme, R subunit
MPPRTPAESEWLTRKQFIDKELRAAGWRVTPFVPGAPFLGFDGCALEEFSTVNGPADYALVMDGRVAGVVEVKKLSLGPQNVLGPGGAVEPWDRPAGV